MQETHAIKSNFEYVFRLQLFETIHVFGLLITSSEEFFKVFLLKVIWKLPKQEFLCWDKGKTAFYSQNCAGRIGCSTLGPASLQVWPTVSKREYKLLKGLGQKLLAWGWQESGGKIKKESGGKVNSQWHFSIATGLLFSQSFSCH